MKLSSIALLISLFLLPVSGARAQAEYRQIDPYLAMVRAEFSAENAYRTTEYVSERWRLPGNPGFDSSIYWVKNILEQAGYTAADASDATKMTYRVESRPMTRPAWEPIDASVWIMGERAPLLQFYSNRNMILINSFSTPAGGFTGEVVYLSDCSEAALEKLDVKGKIVLAECHSQQLFSLAVGKFDAAGIMCYRIPSYNQPEKYEHSIPFTSIPLVEEQQSWGINLSYAAYTRLRAKLQAGPVVLTVNIKTRIQQSEELTLIAEIPGSTLPDERFVYSAHVQEPGANDNASGVGALAEMARVAAKLYQQGRIRPARTLTFIWGDEIRATRRYIQEDQQRAAGIKWGMSLDMVGEDTEKTGGTFLIEKMPDPSVIWTRGEDEHTEWGAGPVSPEDFNPHYFNDLVEAVCRREALGNNWVVKTNPFEGGSDHQPFLDAKIPGLLFWHFTDAFYHTDADRIDKVSATTLKHVGCSALVCGLVLTEGTEASATAVLTIGEQAAAKRLATERKLSLQAIAAGKAAHEEQQILSSWTAWYTQALPKITDMLTGNTSPALQKKLDKAVKKVLKTGSKTLQ